MACGGSPVAFDQRNGTDEGKSAGHCGICAPLRARAEQRSAWSRRVGEQLRGRDVAELYASSVRSSTLYKGEMHIDDLPEDVQGAVRSAASMVGADVNDPLSLKAIMLMIMGANEEKSTTREDIDH